MKKIVYIVSLVVIGALFSNCDTNDNTFYKDVFISVPDLVHIEVPITGYHVNDKVYLSCSIDKLLNVPGQVNLLDVRKTTGNAPNFNFTYLLEKRINANEWEIITIDPSLINVTSGSISSGSFYLATAVFNSTLDSYNFRAGIPLLATGEYRMSFGYNSTSTTAIELRSESFDNNLFLNINSTEDIGVLDGLGYYHFTVI